MFNNINNILESNNNNNNSNNILIQNNTSNYYNIINNNNSITVNSFDDNPINPSSNSNSLSLKKEKIMFNLKYSTEEVIKEESEPGGNSAGSSKIGSGINKNDINSSLGAKVKEENSY